MPILTQAEYALGDIGVRYQAPADRTGAWGLTIFPLVLADKIAVPREQADTPAVRGLPAPWNAVRAWEVDPLVHARLAGEAYPGGYAQGRTLRHSATTHALTVRDHTREARGGRTVIRTTLAAASGLVCRHELVADETTGVLEIQTVAENASDRPLTLESLSSFSLGGLTPFAADDGPGRMRVHRFRSAWSAEGRHEVRRLEELHLERSWTGHGVRSERFGQAGSLPVNGWFPGVGLEDHVAGVTWLAQLACPGTWHLEIYRRADQLALAGGGADRIAGEWRRTLQPGESVAAPPVFLTVVAGSLDEASDRLLAGQRARATARPRSEDSLPIVFNEWCTTWGHPTHDRIVALADRLAGTGVTYLVIDDGWAERSGSDFQQNGDWRVNRRAFPGGLRATADAVRARGLVPGLWFEFEAINPGSDAWGETSHQLHRDGVPLEVGNRRFWDFRDPWVHAYFARRVLARLRDDGLGYLKVDCNDSIGPGVDGDESPGENLRQHLAGVQRFLARLHAELPDLVIENCASGGHRLEPSMLALTAMSSSSDAHETPDLPLIAANLNRLVWSAQKQIWAVLRRDDSLRRLSYSLAATFLGRMCLSGDVESLGEPAWRFVCGAVAFYRQVAPVIRDGAFRCARSGGDSYQHPTGWQVVTVHDPTTGRLLAIWHRFANPGNAMTVTLPEPGQWELDRELSDAPGTAICAGNQLQWPIGEAWSGGVLLMRLRSTRT
ncbi:MAG TPA: glycoside hydrolase family 36 protein [Opitutaceae bacterium]|nr:glycoside hydrolase family 36 protein [Opitutaceae bacterium]